MSSSSSASSLYSPRVRYEQWVQRTGCRIRPGLQGFWSSPGAAKRLFFRLVGGICGQWRASESRLGKELVKLAARGIEGSLLIFPAVIEEGSAVLDHLPKNQLHWLLSQ